MTFNLARLRVAAALCLLGAGTAMAQSSPWYLGVAQTLSHESNVRRVADGRVLPAGISRSDTISSTALVGGLDQPIGRQRVFGTANISTNRYSSNNGLNDTSYSLNLGLDWSTVNRLSGTLSASFDQKALQFETLNASADLLLAPNDVRSQQLDALFRLGVVTRYTLEAALGWRKREYSAASYQDDEFSQNNLSLGVRWRPSNLLNAGVALRMTQAKYPQFQSLPGGGFLSDTLNRHDIDFTAGWQPSGASQLNLRLSPTRNRYDRNTVADFSGVTGSLNWVWKPTGKSTLTTLVSRDTGQSADAVNVGIANTNNSIAGVLDQSTSTFAMGLRASHELTGKLSLNASLDHARRNQRQQTIVGAVGAGTVTGKDNTTILRLGARWLPTRSTQVSCNLGTERRSSDGRLTAAYSANSVGCSGQIVLQ